jgi:two-component system response regulator PilR (NtrC family)
MASQSRPSREKSPPGERIQVLLIDDEADSLFPILAQHLTSLGFDLNKESDATSALATIQATAPQIILLDLHFPGDERRDDGRTAGGELLVKIRRQFSSIPVVVFTTRLDDIDIPLETFDEQAHGYFAKPSFANDASWPKRLAQTMRDAIDTGRFAHSPDDDQLGFLVGQTKEMHEVVARIRTAARTALTVLIYGETGSGKQLAAEAIHRLSGRTGRFEHYNCSGAHLETLDSTLFGHLRGAFTGANETKAGLLELSDKGTLFLDELQDVPIAVQNKLLIFVETGVFRPMGATSDKKVDVRLIVATNHSLSDLVADGVLREDLAYRLGVSLIFLPPLRQRKTDLPGLFRIFVAKANKTANRNVLPVLRPETLHKLEAHRWSGNIRELEAAILRAVAHTNSNILLPEDIEILPVARIQPTQSQDAPSGTALSSPPAGVAPVSLALTLTNYLESLDVGARYDFIKSHGRDLQKEILIEVTRRLRERTGRRVTHKALALELDPLVSPERDLNKIRQFLFACGVQLTQLDFNQ